MVRIPWEKWGNTWGKQYKNGIFTDPWMIGFLCDQLVLAKIPVTWILLGYDVFFWGAWKKSSKMSIKRKQKQTKPGEISTALRLRCHHDEVKKGKGEANPRRMAALLVEHLEAGENGAPLATDTMVPFLHGVDKIPPFSLWIVAWFLSWNLRRFLHHWLLTHTFFQWNVDQGTLGRLPATNSYLSSLWQMKIFEKSPPSGYEAMNFIVVLHPLSPTMMVQWKNICIWKVTIRLEDTCILHRTMELWEKLVWLIQGYGVSTLQSCACCWITSGRIYAARKRFS